MKPVFVQWGAGNIGRAFIAQVFASHGYQVCFVDIDTPLIDLLNKSGAYTVRTIDGEVVKELRVEGVTAVQIGRAHV